MKTSLIKKVIRFGLASAIAISMLSTVVTAAESGTGKALVFSDVKAGSWYKQYVDIISAKGITAGIGNGKFGPNNDVKVDELLTWMVKANNIKITHKDTDVYWGCPYIRAAKEQGWVKDEEFESYKVPIKRGEIARIIARAMPYEKTPIALEEYKNLFKDYNDIQPALRTYILKVRAAGIISGYYDAKYDTGNSKDPYNGMVFGAEKTATRAEASTMIVNYITPSLRKEPSIVVGEKEAVYNGFKTGVEGVNTALKRIEGTPETEFDGRYDLISFKIVIWKDFQAQPQLAEQGFKEAREVLIQKIDEKTVDKALEYAKTKTDPEMKLDSKYFESADKKYVILVQSITYEQPDINIAVYYNK